MQDAEMQDEVLEVELDETADKALGLVAAEETQTAAPIEGRFIVLNTPEHGKEFALAFSQAEFWQRLKPSKIKTVEALYTKDGKLVANEKQTGGKVLVAPIRVPSVLLANRGRTDGMLNIRVRPVRAK